MRAKWWIVCGTLGLLTGLGSALGILAYAYAQSPSTLKSQNSPINNPPRSPVTHNKIQAPKNTVPWELLGQVKLTSQQGKLLPDFPKPVSQLNQQSVKLFGFMIPLKAGDKHDRFLITFNPQTCTFCMPAGPEGMVEVNTSTPIAYSYEPILLQGIFITLKDDPNGLYYRLVDAKQQTYTP